VTVTITYRDVFGVDPGAEIVANQHLNYRPSMPVAALLAVLGRYAEFRGRAHGPSGFRDEFNRHHAGLAVDIMVATADFAMVTLWQHLYLLFIQHRGVMRWRGMIFQHAGVNYGGGTSGRVQPFHWAGTDHMNHIHIDWLNHHDVHRTDPPITTIPIRHGNNPPRPTRVRGGHVLAASIAWTPQAETLDFRTNSTLTTAMSELLARRSSLAQVDLESEVRTAT
jgi:hypothetical protein